MRVSAIAKLVDAEWGGGVDPEITGVAPLDRAQPTDLSFIANPRYLRYTEASQAGAILVSQALESKCSSRAPRIVVPDVYGALAVLLDAMFPEPAAEPGIDATAVIGSGVRLGPDAVIGPFAVIGPGCELGTRVSIGAHCVVGHACVLGDDVTLHPHVTLYPRVRVGARSILHSGVRVGVDGFGFAYVGGRHAKVPQVGGCVIGADVEIGANTTIDRGSIGDTEIGDGVKIDNLVQIGHNVRVGAHSVIVAQVGVAGSTTIGERVTLAGQAGIQGHITIGDGATIAGQAGVFGDVPAGATYSGYPARPHKEALRTQAGLARLPKLMQRVAALERGHDPGGGGG